MPFRVLLYLDQAGRTIALTGAVAGDAFTLDSLVLPGAAAPFRLVTPLTGSKAALLEAVDAAAGDYRFKVETAAGATLSARFTVAAGTLPFGRGFHASGQVAASVTVHIRKTGVPPIGAAVVVRVCGRLRVGAGADEYVPAPLCFEAVLAELPTAFPVAALPRLGVRLPDIALPLPALELPWDLTLPLPPYRLPALALPLDPLPLRVGFRSAEVRVDNAGTANRAVVLDFRGVILAGLGQTVELDLAITAAEGQPVAGGPTSSVPACETSPSRTGTTRTAVSCSGAARTS